MKRIVKIAVLALVFAVVCCLVPAGQVSAKRMLTLDRAVQINDYQIVLEFSEPIAINLLASNRGPAAVVRIVGSNNTLKYDNTTPLQWPGIFDYVDSVHDRVLFTLLPASHGVRTINDIRYFNGELARFAKDSSVAMCLEEVPYELFEPVANGLLDNITTADGEVYLWANRPGGWDGAYLPINVDYGYEIDFDKLETIEIFREREIPTFELGEARTAQAEEPAAEPEVIVQEVVKNNPLINAAIIGGGALLAVVVILILCRKQPGKAGRTK